MSRLHRGGLAAALALSILGAGRPASAQNAAPSPQDTPAGDATNGKRMYLAVGCFTCHGRAGQGGNFNYPAPALAQSPLPVEVLKIFLRVGPNDMPAYAESVLSDKDAADIYAFVRSLPGRRSAKDVPLLNQ